MAVGRRCFLGLESPSSVCEALSQVIARRGLRQVFPDCRWVHPAEWHITLVFLGELDDRALTSLIEALSNRTPPGGRVSLPMLASFPDLDRGPWFAAWAEVAPEVQALRQGVLEIVKRAGHPVDPRPWRPHLTLARPRPHGGRPLPQAQRLPVPLHFEARALSLFESLPTRRVARYSVLSRWPLSSTDGEP